MAWLGIVARCVALACVYGVAHDLVTAHVCLEYFTVFHPPLCPVEVPVVQALVWGVAATWWVGAGVGTWLAVCARAGSAPKWTAARLTKPVLALLAALFVASMAAGAVGYLAGTAAEAARAAGIADPADRPGAWFDRRFPERWPRFLFNAWAHSAAYGFGALGGLGMGGWILFRRRAEARGPAAAKA